MKDRIATSHDKDLEHGKAYRSIQTTRVRAAPNWEADAVTVGFYFILEDEDQRVATRDKIAETITTHFAPIKWPAGFRPEEPAFLLQTLDETTAREWVESQPIDWEFISTRSKLKARKRLNSHLGTTSSGHSGMCLRL